MDKDMITLWAKAKQAGIEDYRKIPPATLRKLVEQAQTRTSKPAKGKTATSANGRNGAKGKAAATTVVKGKPAAPAKGKAVPAKPAAKPTTRTVAPAKGKGKATTTKPVARKAAPKAAPAAKRTSTRGQAAEGYAVRIDNSAIDWTADWKGGSASKRGIVMDSLRKHRGDKAKVFAEVKRHATRWYPDKDKHAADRMVIWLIGRVALDFVKATGQHESGERAAYGTSTKPNDIRRREARAAVRPKTTRTRRAVKPAAAKPAPARGKAAPATRKPAQARTAAPKGKPAASRKAPATRTRATAVKGKGKAAAKARR